MPSNTGYYTPPPTAYDTKKRTGPTSQQSLWEKMKGDDYAGDVKRSWESARAEGNPWAANSLSGYGAPIGSDVGFKKPDGTPWLMEPGPGWTGASVNGGGGGGRVTPLGGGGGGYGGGGGGGGGMSAALQQALARLRPHLMSASTLRLPEYQTGTYTPTEMPQFDPRVYQMALQAVADALARDRRATTTGFDNLDQVLAGQTNPYANAAWAQSPQMEASMARLLSNPVAQSQVTGVADTANQLSRAGDATMGGLFATLGAQEQRNMQSRNREAAQDRLAATTRLGDRASMAELGVSMARAQAEQAWRQWLAQMAQAENQFGAQFNQGERQFAYQPAMQQALANWQAQNQVSQGNAEIRNNWLGQMLGLAPGFTDQAAIDALLAQGGEGSTG